MAVDWVSEMQGAYVHPTVVCLGLFDGVHLGHLSLLREANRVAANTGLIVCAHTYANSPNSVVLPTQPFFELTPLDDKVRLLTKAGAERIAVSHFDSRFMHMTGYEFIIQILIEKLCVRHVVVGFNHRFGYHGQTDSDQLKEYCDKLNIGISIMPPVKTRDGQLISSSAIRKCICSGEIETASEMLGRPADEAMVKRCADFFKSSYKASRDIFGGHES